MMCRNALTCSASSGKTMHAWLLAAHLRKTQESGRNGCRNIDIKIQVCSLLYWQFSAVMSFRNVSIFSDTSGRPTSMSVSFLAGYIQVLSAEMKSPQ